MKKLIILLTVFTLIGVTTAAQINIGGTFEITANLAMDETWSQNDPRTAMHRDMIINLGAQTPDGSFGAMGSLVRNLEFWVYAWWKPVDFFKLKLGSIFEDSTWVGAVIADDEGLHGNKFNTRVTRNFAGNVLANETGFFDPHMTELQIERAMQLSFYPIPGLAINLGFPMDRSAFNNMAEYNYIYKLHAQVAYDFGFGTAAITFINAVDEPGEFKTVFAHWNMLIGDAMNLELGFNVGFNSSATAPINIGFGFGYGDYEVDGLVVNARLGASIAIEDNENTRIGADIVPSFGMDRYRFYFPVGFALSLPWNPRDTPRDPSTPRNSNRDVLFYWSLTPYVSISLNGPYFIGGIRIFNDPVRDGIAWAIPVGFRWDF
jgi:hypothetical protein